LKTIEHLQFLWISAGLFDHALEDAKFESDDQSRISRFDFPDAAKIRGNDFQIAVDVGSAVPLACAAAINGNRRSYVQRNDNSG
jgi:hypothetical protein